MPFFCHYCGKDKPDDKRTKEHVIPKALGGNVEPGNPFLLDVCAQCNSACGRYVDGPFIRSWFTQMERFGNARRYIDLDRDPCIPLLYVGESQEIKWEDTVCDYWQGPAGDHVLHFHMRYQDSIVRPDVGPPIGVKPKDIDPGFILIFLCATHPKWARCVIRSVTEQIDDAVIYVVNGGPRPDGPRFGEIPNTLKPLIEQVFKLLLARKPLTVDVAFRPDSGDRFLAKLALGFGSLLLDDSFRTSADAMKLRNFVWAKTAKEREPIGLNGTTFFENSMQPRPGPGMSDLLGWQPGHVVLLQAYGQEALGLSVIFYGTQNATVMVTTNHAHWRGRLVGTDTVQSSLFLIAPGFRTFVGPVPLSKYVAARGELPKGNILPVVGPFLKAVEDHAPPPPFEAPEEERAHQKVLQ
jgi:hypothetical protein